jgi:hypothetical protein
MAFILNIEKAKELFLNKLRRFREDKWSDLDVSYMRALEFGNQSKISEIVFKKEQLRNITDMNLSDVENLNDLKSKWPTELLGKSPYEN